MRAVVAVKSNGGKGGGASRAARYISERDRDPERAGIGLRELGDVRRYLAVIATVLWLVRDLAVRQRTHGDSPIRVDEVKGLIAEAVSRKSSHSGTEDAMRSRFSRSSTTSRPACSEPGSPISSRKCCSTVAPLPNTMARER